MKKLFFIALCMFCLLDGYAQDIAYHKWKFGVSGGLSFLTAGTKRNEREFVNIGISPKTAKNYYGDLKKGKIASANVVYLFKENTGVGLKYNLFSSEAKINNIVLDFDGDGNMDVADIKEQLYYNFIGPSFYFQKPLNASRTFLLTGQMAVGYMHYRDEMRSVNNILATGGTIGYNTELGIEYFFSGNWAVALNIDATSAILSKVTLEDAYDSVETKLKGDSRIQMSHIAVLLGIRFYK
jgi:hypothetical protein